MLPGLALAEVKVQSSAGFVSSHQLRLAGTPKQVYRALTREVQHWWDASHSYSGRAKNFRLEAVAGGCFCERLPQGGSVEHMRVVFAQLNPIHRLRHPFKARKLRAANAVAIAKHRLVANGG